MSWCALHLSDLPSNAEITSTGDYVIGGSVTLTCSYNDGNPAAEIIWLKDGTPLEGETGSDLALTLAADSEGSQYSCQVANDVGSVTSSLETIELSSKKNGFSRTWVK